MEDLQHTPNRMTCNAGVEENSDVLVTTFKISPKSPTHNNIQRKKSLFKKKGVKKALLHQRNRLDSQSSEPSADSSQLRSQQQVTPYKLIEFYGDSSRIESDKENSDNITASNQNATISDCSAITPGSENLNDLQSSSPHNNNLRTAGISVHRTSQKVILVIPEEWASSIEILRLPLSADLNSLEDLSTSSVSNSVGPIRSHTRVNRNTRNTPYYSSRRDKQNYFARANGGESRRIANRISTKNQNIFENIESVRYYNTANNGYKYEARDYQQTANSNAIGPIRRNKKRKAFYTPYGNAARERTDYNSVDSASSNTSDRDPYYFDRKDYHKSIVCWHCQRKGHIRINCPSWIMTRRYKH